MPKLNVQQNNQNVIQAFKNALAIGNLKGIIASDGNHNFSTSGSNPNLLDNAYFVGGGSQLGYGIFPINQKGQTSYSGSGRYIDRWVALNNASGMTLNADGIVFSNTGSGYGYVAQPRTRAKAQSGYTLSVLTADGTVYTAQGINSITLPSGLYFYWGSQSQLAVRVPANLTASETIAEVKYEKGTVSTILNDAIPDFDEELRKCYKGYVVYDNSGNAGAQVLGSGYAHSASAATFTMTLPTPMVATPTTAITGEIRLQNGSANYTVASVTNVSVCGNQLTIGCSLTTTSATVGAAGGFILRPYSKLAIDANI